MPDFFLPFAWGNLSALIGHLISWRLRAKKTWLVQILGCMGLALGCFGLWHQYARIDGNFHQAMDGGICGNAYFYLKQARNAEIERIMQAAKVAVFLTMFFALINQNYVSRAWWREMQDVGRFERFSLVLGHWLGSLLIVWGELFCGFVTLAVSYFSLATYQPGVRFTPVFLYGGFAVTWLFLTFL